MDITDSLATYLYLATQGFTASWMLLVLLCCLYFKVYMYFFMLHN